MLKGYFDIFRIRLFLSVNGDLASDPFDGPSSSGIILHDSIL